MGCKVKMTLTTSERVLRDVLGLIALIGFMTASLSSLGWLLIASAFGLGLSAVLMIYDGPAMEK